MLKNISPLITPELLKTLAEMGHGDEIVLADANFTAMSLAAELRSGVPVIRLPGTQVAAVAKAVLDLFPLDQMVDAPVAYMHVSDKPAGFTSAVQSEVIAHVQAADTRAGSNAEFCSATERFAFYDRVKKAYAIVQTGEMQPYANFIFKKGVLADALLA